MDNNYNNQPMNNGYQQPNNMQQGGYNQPMNNGYQQPMYNQPMNGGYDPNMYNMHQQPEKKSKIGLIIVLAVLFIGAVVVILFLTGVLGGKDKEESSNSNSNSNEVSNSNSNSNEPSNSNSNEPSNSNSNYNSNSNSNYNSNSNGNGTVSQSDINGVYTCGNSTTVTVTSYSFAIVGISSGKTTSVSGTLSLDNSISTSFNYRKSGYSYNSYHLKNIIMVQGTQTTKADHDEIVILGLSDDKKSLHIVTSVNGSTNTGESVCTKKY